MKRKKKKSAVNIKITGTVAKTKPPALRLQPDKPDGSIANLLCVVCSTPTHAFPTCYLSSCCVENIAPTDSFTTTSHSILQVMGKKKGEREMAIKPSCCLLSHSEI